MLTYLCERDFACLYSLSNPELARVCALASLTAAHALCRPDLVWDALQLIAALRV